MQFFFMAGASVLREITRLTTQRVTFNSSILFECHCNVHDLVNVVHHVVLLHETDASLCHFHLGCAKVFLFSGTHTENMFRQYR